MFKFINKRKIFELNSWGSYYTKFTGYKERKTACVEVVKIDARGEIKKTLKLIILHD